MTRDPAPDVILVATSMFITSVQDGPSRRAHLCRHGIAINCPICQTPEANS